MISDLFTSAFKKSPFWISALSVVIIGLILVQLETSIGEKIANMGYTKIIILIFGLATVSCNVFVPSRIDRFEHQV